jgi:sugar (pentulose or hexulose) kinase
LNPQASALGIDAGTTAVRIVAVSDSAEILAEGRAGIGTHPQARQATQDPSAWWQATQAALLTIGQQMDLKKIRALSIDATSGTVLAVDRHGVPVSGGSMYNDKALPATIDALERVLPENSASRGATSPLARMIELQRPGIHKLLHQADWLTGKFSGCFDLSDENNALKSGFDVITRAWPDWIGNTQLDPRLLPRVIPTGTVIGQILPHVAVQFGFDPSLRIVSGTTDGCASFVASGACKLGDGVTSLGTTLTLKQVCAKPIAVAKFGIYSHRLGDLWLCGGASNSGGAALLKFFSLQRITELEPKLVPEQDTHLNYYPLPGIGERFPHADPFLQPVVHPRPADDARFLQGLLEGIAAIERSGYSRLEEFGAPPLERVLTVGGGSHNEAWCRIRRRVLGVPVEKAPADTAYGAALIALSALKQEAVLSARWREP